jgi:hypothetical protein
MAEFDALDDAGDDLADAVLELLILPLALGVADLLEDDLLGGLRCDRPNSIGGSGSTMKSPTSAPGCSFCESSRLTCLK